MSAEKKRSGFIKVHCNKVAVFLRKECIVGIWFSKQNECTMIDTKSSDDWRVDETPEQILKLIEEVEG